MTEFQKAAEQIIKIGRQLYSLGMAPATSGNFSSRLSDDTVAITVSGAHKGFLSENDIMLIDRDGQSLDGRRSSAETLLHTGLYQLYPSVNVVLHPHSVNATVLSRLCDDWLLLQDYELLKAFKGIDTHECEVKVPVFENDQDIDRLSGNVDECLKKMETVHGYLIKGHGFYTWGANVDDAMRHVEAFEFLFECELRMRGKSK